MAGDVSSFCVLLWRRNGGPVDYKGRPIDPNRQLRVLTSDEIEDDLDDSGERKYARGNCQSDIDCNQCAIMLHELSFYPAEEVHWVCPACIGEVLEHENAVVLPGHHGEGYCTYYDCQRPERQEVGERFPGIKSDELVTVPGKYSRLLQLVIGRITT